MELVGPSVSIFCYNVPTTCIVEKPVKLIVNCWEVAVLVPPLTFSNET